MSDLVLFYYTLVILLVTIMASATCFATFLVSRRKITGYAAIGFLLYFADVVLVFQNDFLNHNLIVPVAQIYHISTPFLSIVTGGGTLFAFWLAICEFIHENRPTVIYFPLVFFVVSSIGAYTFIPSGGFHQFAFYSMRELTAFLMLLFLGFFTLSHHDSVERERLLKHSKIYALLWLMVMLIVIENILFQLAFDASIAQGSQLVFLPERNIAENLLLLVIAGCFFRYCYRILVLYYKTPPAHSESPLQTYIDQNVHPYAHHYDLSEREEEVLALVLQGKDNQNIATDLHVALSTVKVHVHNILKKTQLENRQAIIKDFWKRS